MEGAAGPDQSRCKGGPPRWGAGRAGGATSDFQRRFAEHFGQSDSARALLQEILSVALTTESVLIVGEAGSQKAAVARIIHDSSPRARAGFASMDCSGLPGGEREILGDLVGSLRSAKEGTLFINHVERLPASAQRILLQIIGAGRYVQEPAGEPMECDVRIIAGTTRTPTDPTAWDSLDPALRDHLLRRVIVIPPLRERPEDILTVAESFRRAACVELRKTVRTFDPRTRRVLLEHSWPGNYAELWHVIHRAVASAPGEELRPEAIMTALVSRPDGGAPADAMVQEIIRAQSRAFERFLAGQQERVQEPERTGLVRRLLDLARWRGHGKGAGEQAGRSAHPDA